MTGINLIKLGEYKDMSELVASVGGGNGGGGRRKYFVDPKRGMYDAVCVDVINLGFVKEYGKIKQKLQFAFQLDKEITEKMISDARVKAGLEPELSEGDIELVGKRLLLRSKKMALSLFPGGTSRDGKPMRASDLYTFVEDWNGEAFPEPTPESPITINFEEFIGRGAEVMVQQKADKNNPHIIYSNLVSIAPLEEGKEPLELDDSYTRVKDRENFTPPPTEDEVLDADDGEIEASSSAAFDRAMKGAESPEIPWDN